MEKNVIDVMLKNAEAIAKRYVELEDLMCAPEVTADKMLYLNLLKERCKLEPMYFAYTEYLECEKDLKFINEPEFSEAEDNDIKSERKRIGEQLEQCLERLKSYLLPGSLSDAAPALIELKAEDSGSGALLGMIAKAYLSYAENNYLKPEVLTYDGDFPSSSTYCMINLPVAGAYGNFRFESGIHKGLYGKKGTAKVEVLVMPNEAESGVQINESDLKVDIFHSSGAGGQNINKVETAVRMTHIPTGIVVTCQNERSQLQNRNKATEIMAVRLAEYQRQNLKAKRLGDKASLKAQLKIVRTYDFVNLCACDVYGLSLPLHSVFDGKLDTFAESAALHEVNEKCR